MGSEEIKITKHLREAHKDCTLGSLEGNRGPASSHPMCRTTRMSRDLRSNGSGAALLELSSTHVPSLILPPGDSQTDGRSAVTSLQIVEMDQESEKIKE